MIERVRKNCRSASRKRQPGRHVPNLRQWGLRQGYRPGPRHHPRNFGLRIGADADGCRPHHPGPAPLRVPKAPGFESPTPIVGDAPSERSRNQRHITRFYGALGGRPHLLRFQLLVEVSKSMRCISSTKVALKRRPFKTFPALRLGAQASLT